MPLSIGHKRRYLDEERRGDRHVHSSDRHLCGELVRSFRVEGWSQGSLEAGCWRSRDPDFTLGNLPELSDIILGPQERVRAMGIALRCGTAAYVCPPGSAKSKAVADLRGSLMGVVQAMCCEKIGARREAKDRMGESIEQAPSALRESVMWRKSVVVLGERETWENAGLGRGRENNGLEEDVDSTNRERMRTVLRRKRVRQRGPGCSSAEVGIRIPRSGVGFTAAQD
ncbi:hypothetical protein BU15DRAFT_62814 [Melanogaster broomeanus]|nr:hypothetical protein BU15DRAFT_62814 [Melanogaster broomeanus]